MLTSKNITRIVETIEKKNTICNGEIEALFKEQKESNLRIQTASKY